MKLALARRISRCISRAWPYWPIVLAVGVWLMLSWPMLSGQTVVGFRDSAYFFFPYFKWIDQTWSTGEIPLWNPYCNLGYPVVGDTTSGVFYPGKIVFFLRFLSFPSRYGLFVSGHMLLAGIGAYRFSRRLGATLNAATLAAVSYALGGSVLFQSTNVIYLISAAILPLALDSIWNMLHRRHSVDALAAGCFIALFVLGGDPQMAYVCGLIALALWVASMLRIRRAVSFSRSRSVTCLEFARFSGGRIGTAFVVAAALSAVQILPAVIWSSESSRSNPPYTDFSDLWEPIRDGSRVDEIYQFSQPPWSLMELFWPNVSGKPYPHDQRWTSRLPGADRMWTPSLYVGLPAILLGLSAMRLSGRSRRRIWLTKIAWFFGMASLGWYGAVWLFNEIAMGLGFTGLTNVAEPVGGLYWLMLAALPKFFLFRYPAKLFVVASLMICVLAGLQLSRTRRCSPVSPWLPAAVVLGLVIVLVWWSTALTDPGWLRQDPDWMFGPFDQRGVRNQWFATLIHTAAVAGLLLIAMLFCHRRARDSWQSVFPATILLVAMADLAIANYWLVPQVDSAVLESGIPIRHQIDRVAGERCSDELRMWATSSIPLAWRKVSSTNRLQEVVRWQRETLHPKHHLSIPVNMIGSFTSIAHPANDDFIVAFSRWAQATTPLEGHDRLYRIPRLKLVEAAESGSRPVEAISDDILLQQFLADADDHSIDLVYWSNTRVRCRVHSDSKAVLLFNCLPMPGWQVRVDDERTGRPLPDGHLDAGQYFLAARIPAGTSQIEFRYSPVEFWVGAVISLVSWFSLSVYFTLRALRTLRH